MLKNPVLCAIDTTDLDEAVELAASLKDIVGGIKLGLEFFVANGPEGVKEVVGYGTKDPIPFFLDLKLHDIPKVIGGSVATIAELGAFMTTVHASAGKDGLQAASDAAREYAIKYRKEKMLIMGVTVLTSMDDEDVEALGISDVNSQVARLAGLAKESGVDGCICSSHEIGRIRDDFGSQLKLAVPGIRPHGSGTHDQKRIMTASAALDLGADYLVVGRPITEADDPVAAAKALIADLSRE